MKVDKPFHLPKFTGCTWIQHYLDHLVHRQADEKASEGAGKQCDTYSDHARLNVPIVILPEFGATLWVPPGCNAMCSHVHAGPPENRAKVPGRCSADSPQQCHWACPGLSLRLLLKAFTTKGLYKGDRPLRLSSAKTARSCSVLKHFCKKPWVVWGSKGCPEWSLSATSFWVPCHSASSWHSLWRSSNTKSMDRPVLKTSMRRRTNQTSLAVKHQNNSTKITASQIAVLRRAPWHFLSHRHGLGEPFLKMGELVYQSHSFVVLPILNPFCHHFQNCIFLTLLRSCELPLCEKVLKSHEYSGMWKLRKIWVISKCIIYVRLFVWLR